MIAPFVVALVIVISAVLPGHTGSRIVTDLFSRLADKILWPNSYDVTITGKRRRR